MPKLPGLPAIPGFGELVDLLQAQTQALAALPDTLKTLNKNVRTLTTLAADAQATLRHVDEIALRANAILDELEEPLRALAPGLARLGRVLDDPATDKVPAILDGLADTERQVAAIAASTGRIMALIDEAGARIEKFPGAAFVAARGRRTARPKE